MAKWFSTKVPRKFGGKEQGFFFFVHDGAGTTGFSHAKEWSWTLSWTHV